MLECIKNWLECIKNSYATAKEWMDKDEALWVESKLGLDSNSELKSISFTNMIHPSLEEALDEINPRLNLRATNPWEILDNKTSNECHRHGMMESIFLPIDIHKEPTLESKMEDDITSMEAISLTPHQIHAHMRNLLNQLVSPTLPHTRSSTPSFSMFIKTLKGWL